MKRVDFVSVNLYFFRPNLQTNTTTMSRRRHSSANKLQQIQNLKDAIRTRESFTQERDLEGRRQFNDMLASLQGGGKVRGGSKRSFLGRVSDKAKSYVKGAKDTAKPYAKGATDENKDQSEEGKQVDSFAEWLFKPLKTFLQNNITMKPEDDAKAKAAPDKAALEAEVARIKEESGEEMRAEGQAKDVERRRQAAVLKEKRAAIEEKKRKRKVREAEAAAAEVTEDDAE